MAKSKNAPKALPELSVVKAAMIDAITRHLTTAVSASDNTYFTVPGRQIPLNVGAVQGTFSVSLFNLKDAALVEAATVESAKVAVSRLTDEQKAALIEELMAG